MGFVISSLRAGKLASECLAGRPIESLNFATRDRYRLRMNLEDHVGDIIRKARAMTGVSAADAARAAGLNEADFSALEESGKTAGKIKFPELAAAVG